MIRLENVNKFYRSGSERIHAIKNFNVTFPNRGLVFIIGPSGCGKSTLLNLLGGLDKADQGHIWIENRTINSFSKKELNDYLNSYLGFVFQEYNILKDLNLYQNISLPLEMQKAPRREIKKRVKQILTEVELDNLEKRKVHELSGGQRQRIAIARALIKNPKMIIADEPTGNLDSETSETIFKLFKKLAEDRLIIIVTHDEESAFLYGDRIIQMEDGAIVADSQAEFKGESIEPLHLKRAHVPLGTSVKLSLKNIYKKKMRFLIMMIISALSLAFLSFTIELKGDKLRQNIYTAVENGYQYTDIQAKANLPEEFIKGDYYKQYQGHPLPQKSYETLKDLNPGLNIHKYQAVNIDISLDNYKIARTYYPGYIHTIVQYDEHNQYNLVAGRLPEKPKEILVTDYLIDHFVYYDRLPRFDTPYDYIGRLINLSFQDNYRIVGIVKTDHRSWLHFFQDSAYNSLDKTNYAFQNEFMMMNAVILWEDDFEIEKMTLSSTLDSSRYLSTGSLSVTGTDDTYAPKNFSFSNVNQNILHARYYGYIGGYPTAPNSLLLPYSLAEILFGVTINKTDFNQTYLIWKNQISPHSLTLSINQEGMGKEPFVKEFSISGLSDSPYIQLDKASYSELFRYLVQDSENILAELPTDPNQAYQLFNTAYNNGYVLNVWPYRNDIDAYTIDPFVDLITKAGLFVFAVFSIGILWTITTLDIVDSKKEIGIFRSIGLSGFRVSFIYIFQTFVINIASYIAALFMGAYAIKYFNSSIMDELNQVHLSMFMPTTRSPLYLIVFLIITTTLALFVPLYKIMSQKIIDVISERDSL